MTEQLPASRGFSRRSMLGALLVAATALPLAACSSSDSLTEQANSGDGKNYIAGDGSVEEYQVEDRTDAVDIKAETFEGDKVDFAAWQGKPVVMNFWYAACAPCRLEAPHLKELAEQYQGKAEFIGVNVRDEAAAAQAFERTFKIPYGSIQDTNGAIQQTMTKYVPLQAVPSTLVLDRKGRVRARVLGAIEPGTLKSLIDSALSEEL